MCARIDHGLVSADKHHLRATAIAWASRLERKRARQRLLPKYLTVDNLLRLTSIFAGMSKMKPLLRIILINSILIAGAVGLAESWFGSWFRVYASDYFLIPRNTSIEYDIRFSEVGWKSVYRRDQYGLRGSHAHPRAIDILTLGGSTTDQRLLGLEQTWQYALQETLARSGIRSVVGNAGIDGHSTVGHIRSLDTWLAHLPELKPKWVILYVGINDRAVEDIDSPDPMDGRNESKTFYEKIRAVIVQRSALYSLYRAGKGLFVAEKYRIGHGFLPPLIEWTKIDPQPQRQIYSPRLDAYAQRLDRLVEAIRQRWGADLIFVTQPLAEYRVVNGELFARNTVSAEAYVEMRQYNDVLLARCRYWRQTCIDLAGELDFADGDFYDPLHTSPQGSRRIGEFIGQRLVDVISAKTQKSQ